MFSMTGFGKGEYKADGIEISVEVKTVNNRYLDVFVNYIDKRERPKSLYVDAGAASGYCAAAKKLKDLFPGLADDFTLTALMRSPDVVRQEETQGADEALLNALQAALCKALDNLNAMRKKEGEKLSDDMLSRMDAVEKLVDEISARAPLVAAQYKSKLEERMKEILNGAAYDEARLLTEVAVFTDKANIDEELTRLRSHIAQFRNICREERVGRKLDFLVQEFNRECNTVCSKSNDLKVTDCGLALKNEIEKIREQVQNVE